MADRRLTFIHFAEAHYNRNAGCMIPAAWEGVVEIDDPLSAVDSTKILGGTPCDVVAIAESDGVDVSPAVRRFAEARRHFTDCRYR